MYLTEIHFSKHTTKFHNYQFVPNINNTKFKWIRTQNRFLCVYLWGYYNYFMLHGCIRSVTSLAIKSSAWSSAEDLDGARLRPPPTSIAASACGAAANLSTTLGLDYAATPPVSDKYNQQQINKHLIQYIIQYIIEDNSQTIKLKAIIAGSFF